MEITDILDIEGWSVTPGAYASILTLPSLKTPPSVDWGDEDGVQWDVASPHLEAKEINVSYVRALPPQDMATSELMTALTSSLAIEPLVGEGLLFQDYGEATFGPLRLGLRVAGVTQSHNGTHATLSVRYSMDEPRQGIAYEPPHKVGTGWTIDGIDIATFGLIPLKGSAAAFSLDSADKGGLVVESDFSDGLWADVGRVAHRGQNSHAIPLYFRMGNDKAWSVLRAFTNLLASAGLRSVSLPNGITRQCVYVSCACTQAIIRDGMTRALFTLTLNS